MQGSFQNLCLQQTPQGAAHIAMADMGGVTSSVWKVNITQVTPSATQQPDKSQSPSKSAGRRRRVSVSGGKQREGMSTSNEESLSSTASGSVHNAFDPSASASIGTSPSSAMIVMKKYDGTDIVRDGDNGGRFSFNGSGLPPFVALIPSLAHCSDAAPKDLARQVEVFPIPPSSTEQPTVELTNVVVHEENCEPTCMELRVSEGGGKVPGSKKKTCVLYVGMSNGSIQKHSLRND